MTTAECIRQRVSCRRFQEKPIPREDIRRVVDLARFSPSWKNTQISRYIAIESREERELIANEYCLPSANNPAIILNCPLLVAQTFVKNRCGFERDGTYTTDREEGWQYYDCGIAAQTFCLAARELDIGSCILGIFDADAAGRLLELEGQRAACLIAMGYPEQWKNGPGRKETEELLSFR